MIYPAIWWGWAPPLTYVRFSEDPWGNLGILILPALILGTYLRYESPVDAAGAGRGGAGGGARGGGGQAAARVPDPPRRAPLHRRADDRWPDSCRRSSSRYGNGSRASRGLSAESDTDYR